MKVTLLPSSYSPNGEENQYLTTFVIDESVAVDSGSLGFFGSPRDQAKIRHILLTHTHIDHIASLPIFLENVFEGGVDCVTVHASDVVLDCLRRDIFNDRVWPNFFQIGQPDNPFLKIARLESGRAIELDGLKITPVAVDHLVPTLGLIVESGDSAVVIAGDTGPTGHLWDRARAIPGLKAVFLESAFPDGMTWLADSSKHLTPAQFAGEVKKLDRPDVPIYAVHIKPKFVEQISSELAALGIPSVEICRPGRTYEF